jgi:DNA polymerase III alpha subunit
MSSRREFLRKTALIPVAGMLPGSVVSVGSPKGNVRPETNLERLRRLCLDRLRDRYEQACFPSAIRRLDHELATLDRLGRVDELLVVGELGEFAHEEGIQLRLTGSGCSSIIPYLVGLSDVDPIRHRLFFERFCDPDGRWAPPFAIRVEEQHLDRISRIASLAYGEGFIEETISFMPGTTLERVPWLVVELLQREQGLTVDLRRIPLDDDQAFRLIQRGDNEGMGVFDSDGLRSLLPHLRPVSIEKLAAAATVYTLAIKRGDLLEQYLQQGDEREFPGSENADILEVLAETRGLILYQEQIMMLLNKIGGICPADGFDFIKAVFKRKAVRVAEYQRRFLRNAVGDKTDDETAGRLLDRITEGAGYSSCLCKANYVSEAMMVYQAAYLKAHHRSEFDEVLGKSRGQN